MIISSKSEFPKTIIILEITCKKLSKIMEDARKNNFFINENKKFFILISSQGRRVKRALFKSLKSLF